MIPRPALPAAIAAVRTPPRPSAAGLLLAAPLAAVLFLAAFGPLLSPHGATDVIALPYQPDPGPFGTDRLGRDVLSRILHGGRAIVLIPLFATIAATAIGALLGIIAAALPRDDLIMRLLDLFAVLPALLVALVLFHAFGARPWVLALAVIISSVPFTARYARAAAHPVVNGPWVEQARAIGEPPLAILVHDVLPNLARPLCADAGLRFIGAIYLVAAAGFLGFSPPPPAVDWGSMIAANIDGAALNPWAAIAPSLMILLLTVPANLLADRFARRVSA